MRLLSWENFKGRERERKEETKFESRRKTIWKNGGKENDGKARERWTVGVCINILMYTVQMDENIIMKASMLMKLKNGFILKKLPLGYCVSAVRTDTCTTTLFNKV